ncbi:ABC transporter substrate-binding protein [Chelativorans sp. M5D2P16]|uniref:ABC transporter substrate-binding protein n=1 Tax=Chelativorans sp. M5D2P16 TaxID=3095678 RepID=UPI002ACAFC09|nr:ABC transporter substrate-binding protein [Chelativorans sp. M5D2P16]MDZ5699766.1 ABC transporter substrate-binding protein [Chelativorans sp. M5D2P16]
MRLSILLAALVAANAALAGERAVTDDAGRAVTIPDRPERIVVMHEPLLGLPLMDLGVELVGSYGRTDDGEFVTAVDFMDTVLDTDLAKPKGIGPFGQIDLERLRALEPDLIIGTDLNIDKVEQLSTVAPVYLQNVSTGKAYGFSVEEDLAKVVGREDTFIKRKAAYLDRVAEVRKALPSDPAGQDYLAVFLTDQLNAVGETSGAIQALEDLGYSRLEPEHEGGAAGRGGSMMLVPLSVEAFGRLNPDLLVLMNSYMNDAREEAGTRAALDRIMPGWEKFLKPAKEDRILFLDSAKVTTPTVASAEHTLDAVEAWAKR